MVTMNDGTRTQFDEAKFRKVAAMLGSDTEGERLAALTLANTMLAGAQLNWTEILDGKRHDGSAISQKATAAGPSGSGFENIFPAGFWPDFTKSTPKPEPTPRRTEPKNRYFEGTRIPASLFGYVVIEGQGVTRKNKPMLTVVVESSDGITTAHYGPMKVFDQGSIDIILANHRTGLFCTIQQNDPTKENYAPVMLVREQ